MVPGIVGVAVVAVAAGIADVRIIDATGQPSNAGLLQVKIAGSGGFGTVCGMSTAAASVACRQAGFRSGTISASPCSSYGGGSVCGEGGSAVAMMAVMCKGHEGSLQECPFSEPSEVCLSHADDSVVYCTNRPAAEFTAAGQLRLVDLNGAPSINGLGRLEAFGGSSWAPVCSDGWTAASESVACGSMGFSGVARSLVATPCGDIDGGDYCGGQLPEMSSVVCGGGEASLLDCSYEAGADVFCSSEDNIVLHCSGAGNAQGRPASEAAAYVVS